MKILIVEDEAFVALSLKFLLSCQGHEVTDIADDLSTAIDAVDRETPDLALVDFQLTDGSSGLEVARELCERSILCIFVTGNAPEQPFKHLGIGCLPKPYSDAALAGSLCIAEALLAKTEPPPPPQGFQLY